MKAQELHVTLAQKVRGDSKYLAELTSATALGPVQPGVNSADIEAKLVELANDTSNYDDIRSITGPTGKVYFYSIKHMTEGYARILARVRAGDPCLTIAETVREESRVYPRVTNTELFKYALFKIDREQLDDYVARVQQLYPDIQAIKAPSGTTYLYSTQYLTPDWAALLAKKVEHPDS